MCSFKRSISTWPGITRSPVNSANRFLQWQFQWHLKYSGGRGCAANPRVHFDAARQVHVAVRLAFGAAHLQRDGVIDPIAHGVIFERSIGDRGRERKRRRVIPRRVISHSTFRERRKSIAAYGYPRKAPSKYSFSLS